MIRVCNLKYLSSRKCHHEAYKFWDAVDEWGDGTLKMPEKTVLSK